jgi:hypothetical protein
MSGRRFDDLARMLARSIPRRTVLKGLAASAGAAVAGLGRRGRAEALGQAFCTNDFQCPGSYGFNQCCIPFGAGSGVCCGDNEICSGGTQCIPA